MSKVIHVQLNAASVQKAIREIQTYQRQLTDKCKEICYRLAYYGALRASIDFSGAIYKGPREYSITVEETDHGYRILADGATVLILEFGAGAKMGYGHPKADEFGMGPGTYPDGKGHWNDPKGWWIPKSHGGGHTYGNPPAMPMYNAGQDMRKEIERIAREVFSQ